MDFTFIIAGAIGIVSLVFLGLYFNRRKKDNKQEINDQEIEGKQFQQEKEKGFKEYEFILTGIDMPAERTSRNRQMLLLDMNSYDTVYLELDTENSEPTIVVLNEQGYDLGYIQQKDINTLLPYFNTALYDIEAGVERFFRDNQNENLAIYVTVIEK